MVLSQLVIVDDFLLFKGLFFRPSFLTHDLAIPLIIVGVTPAAKGTCGPALLSAFIYSRHTSTPVARLRLSLSTSLRPSHSLYSAMPIQLESSDAWLPEAQET